MHIRLHQRTALVASIAAAALACAGTTQQEGGEPAGAAGADTVADPMADTAPYRARLDTTAEPRDTGLYTPDTGEVRDTANPMPGIMADTTNPGDSVSR